MPSINHITADELLERLSRGEQVQVIDIREAEEVESGMIPNALHIPMSEVVDRIGEIKRDTESIIVCRSGRRSQSVCKFLYINGYTNATNMTGGMLAWKGQTSYPKCC
ncbi:MAG: rhodanese-like domain-containing protein [Tumebacillaceae bacterium]